MGILSPAAWDARLLEKMKLLLQSAINNPRRRGPPTTYEDFVEGLDVRDEASLRVVEVLLYETTTRRPPPRNTYTDASALPSSSTSAGGASLRRVERSQGLTRRRRHSAIIDIAMSDSDSEEEDVQSARRRPIPVLTTSRRGERSSDVRGGEDWARPSGGPLRLDRSGRDDPSPTLAARQQQIDALFGYIDPLPSFSQVLANISSPSSSTAPDPHLPTQQELWSILLDDPYPTALITSYPSFLDRLNATFLPTIPLIAPDLTSLVSELTRRDPAFPIHIRNLIHRREGGAGVDVASEPATTVSRSHDRFDYAAFRRERQSAGARQNEEAREGIWRVVEHLDQPDVAGRTAAEQGESEAQLTFSEFARRRRAERRETDTEGGDAPPVLAYAGAGRMDVDAPDTPTITVTDASTPATSHAASPTNCPSPPATSHVAPPPLPRTSASVAEAHFRAQRPVAPLPSATSSASAAVRSSPAAGARELTVRGSGNDLREVVETIQRVRAMRGLLIDGETRAEGGEVR